jgi:hypothetical protein
MDLSEIYKHCKERQIEVTSYNPVDSGSLEVLAKGWGCSVANVKFMNQENGSIINIMPSGNERPRQFAANFYEVISPNNVLEFIKGCLMTKTT